MADRKIVLQRKGSVERIEGTGEVQRQRFVERNIVDEADRIRHGIFRKRVADKFKGIIIIFLRV